jgi:tetratricopeptide (TPR) repeat protein
MGEKSDCKFAHWQILQGICPHCGSYFVNGEAASLADQSSSSDLQWDITAMTAALEDPSEEIRSMTVTNVWHYPPSVEVAIPLFSKALTDSSDHITDLAESALHDLGTKLANEEVRRYEDQLPHSGHMLAVRILLLGYYFLRQRDSDARASRYKHVLWLIRHAPESKTAGSPFVFLAHTQDTECYEKAEQIWLEHLLSDPDNTTLLGNAARFFELHSPQRAEELLTKAASLEPSNPDWRDRLGHHFSLQAMAGSSARRENAKRALRELQAAEEIRLGVPEHVEMTIGTEENEEEKALGRFKRLRSLPELAKAAFDAGEVEQARRYALESLESAQNVEIPEFRRADGQAIYDANLILGRCALKDGDMNRAKQYLIAAGNTQGSPALGSFGPNMSLAKELLEHGESQVVLEFFELCRTFWGQGADRLAQWTDAVKCGAIPAFGSNLHY